MPETTTPVMDKENPDVAAEATENEAGEDQATADQTEATESDPVTAAQAEGDEDADADWGAALAEQELADATTSADWGDAMAEQEEADALADATAKAVESDWGTKTAHDLGSKSAKKPGAAAAPFKDFAAHASPDTPQDLDFILDIPVQLTVELGRAKIAIKNLLQLAQGSVVELDGLAGEPMDVLVNGCLIAQGEVVVVNDKFGIRLTDVITPAERIRKLNR